MPEPRLTIRLFGPLEVRLQGEPLPRLRSRTVGWTLALLVLRRERELDRDWLAGTLWPDSTASQASYNLRRSLSQLRRALGSEAWRITGRNRRAAALDLSGAEVDLVCFDETISRADAESLAQAVAVYGGPLLEGCTEEWVLPERQAREQAYLGALECLARASLRNGDAAPAAAHLRRAVAVEPLRETAQRMLLEALAAQGEYGEAVQRYRALRLLLWEELRVEPAPETRAVYERIRAQARDHAQRDVSRTRRRLRYASAAAADLLPPIWNVPHRRNPDFAGREKQFASIEATLAAGGPAALTQAITGLGGIGKTQLALEYAYRHAGDYQAVWWVRSEEPSQLAAEYAALATPLDLPEKAAADQGAIVAAVRRWLERNAGWLLVLDNAPGVEAVIDYLPQGGGGHVLITSRDPNWGGVATPVPVPVLPQEEAVAFLGERTGWTGPEVDVLAEELGCLPLALEQAAAYAAATGCSMATYLDLFHSHRQALLALGKPPTGYQETVSSTWSLSMAQVAAECPAAAGLLSLCAYLAPDGIPLPMVQEGAEDLPAPLAEAARDPLLLHDAVARLRRYSLVSVHDDALSVHRLVQMVARDGLGEEGRRRWALTTARFVLARVPTDLVIEQCDTRFWPAFAAWTPHALAAAELAEPFGAVGDPGEWAGWLLHNVGWYMAARGEIEFARNCFARSVQWGERSLGPDWPPLVWHLQGLACFSENPRPLRERMLALGLKVLGPEHEWNITLYQEVARAQCREGDEVGAQASCKQSLAIAEQVLGADARLTGWVHATLANLAVRRGDLAGARTEAERALTGLEKGIERGLPSVRSGRGWGHFVLAYVLGQQGDFVGERDHLARALTIWERALGAEHDRLTMCLTTIGSFSKPAFGDLRGARDCLERALALQQRGFGSDHPWTFATVTNLARVMQFLGDPAAAKPLAEQALTIVETALQRARRTGLAVLQAFIPVDFSLALITQRAFARTAHDLLASVFLDLGDLEAAECHLDKALLITKDVMFGEWIGPDLEGTAEVLPTLGLLRRLQGRPEEAKECLEQSLATAEHPGPPHQWRMAATHLEYGLALQGMGDLAGARDHLTQAVSMFAFRLGPQHPRTEQARRCVAELGAGRA